MKVTLSPYLTEGNTEAQRAEIASLWSQSWCVGHKPGRLAPGALLFTSPLHCPSAVKDTGHIQAVGVPTLGLPGGPGRRLDPKMSIQLKESAS